MTNPVEPIRGKVARVLNSREVALNKGSSDGVEVGMIFKILSPASAIKDPDTGELLGSIELEKISVEISAVYERVSVASTYRTHKVNVGGIGIGMGLIPPKSLNPPKWETRVESLKTDANKGRNWTKRTPMCRQAT